jgi:uncharacterized membrane protein
LVTTCNGATDNVAVLVRAVGDRGAVTDAQPRAPQPDAEQTAAAASVGAASGAAVGGVVAGPVGAIAGAIIGAIRAVLITKLWGALSARAEAKGVAIADRMMGGPEVRVSAS